MNYSQRQSWPSPSEYATGNRHVPLIRTRDRFDAWRLVKAVVGALAFVLPVAVLLAVAVR